MKGLFSIRTAHDLFQKLEADFRRLQGHPADPYAAFDFFVTAWHLVEWKHPPATDGAGRTALIARHPLLRVCEHLAIGAKHFEPDATRHRNVADTQDEGGFSFDAFDLGSFSTDSFGGELMVVLDGPAKASFGDRVSVSRLAQLVMTTWRAEFPPP